MQVSNVGEVAIRIMKPQWAWTAQEEAERLAKTAD